MVKERNLNMARYKLDQWPGLGVCPFMFLNTFRYKDYNTSCLSTESK